MKKPTPKPSAPTVVLKDQGGAFRKCTSIYAGVEPRVNGEIAASIFDLWANEAKTVVLAITHFYLYKNGEVFLAAGRYMGSPTQHCCILPENFQKQFQDRMLLSQAVA